MMSNFTLTNRDDDFPDPGEHVPGNDSIPWMGRMTPPPTGPMKTPSCGGHGDGGISHGFASDDQQTSGGAA